MRRARRVGLALACIAVLNDEVSPVAVQTVAVRYVVLPVVEVNRLPVSHEPVLVVTDEQVGVAVAKKVPPTPPPTRRRAQTSSNNSRRPSLRFRTYS